MLPLTATPFYPLDVPSEGHIAELRAQMNGPLLRPGDPRYDEARAVWNGMIDKYPYLIARCLTTADVVAAVNFAREHDMLLAVRGGGHNVAGVAVADGGLVIDLSAMREVSVDPEARVARAQGGALIADVDEATQAFGLATPLGVVSETGIAGLTLGGGLGYLRRMHGLSADNLIGAEVVTADGRILEVDEDNHADLLWGLRGGGGNFGIVTRFDYRLHPVGPIVMFVSVMYALEEAVDLLPRWRDFMVEAPEEVSSQALFWTVPAAPGIPREKHGRRVVIFVAVHAGDPDEGERVLAPLRTLSDPLVDFSGQSRFVDVQKFNDAFFPAGTLRYYWKALRIDRLDDEVIARVVRYAREQPSPRTLIVLWHHGGAMSRVPAAATAYGDRSAPFLFSLDTTWEDPADDELNISWTRAVWQEMHVYSGGGLYLNFPGLGEEGEQLVQAAYGENYARLVALKDRYDPDNLFRMNQNIRPTSQGR